MAYKMIDQQYGSGCGYRKEFICDNNSDVAKLPACCTGSAAFVIGTGDFYMVNASGEWQKVGEPSTVSFTIDLYGTVTTYSAEKGMTWREWAESPYNNAEWWYGYSEVAGADGYVTNGREYLDVDPNAVIQDGDSPYVQT